VAGVTVIEKRSRPALDACGMVVWERGKDVAGVINHGAGN